MVSLEKREHRYFEALHVFQALLGQFTPRGLE